MAVPQVQGLAECCSAQAEALVLAAWAELPVLGWAG